MTNNYSVIYEQSQYENFERQILSGYITESKIEEMYENGELDARQVAIAEGLFDKFKARLSGAASGAKAAASNIGQIGRAAGNATMGNQPNLNNLRNVKDEYASSKGANLVGTYNKRIVNSLNQYISDLQDIGLLTPDVEAYISNVAKQIQGIGMERPSPNRNNPVSSQQSGGPSQGGGNQTNWNRPPQPRGPGGKFGARQTR